MNKKKNILLLCFVLCSNFFSYCQNLRLNGLVIDNKSKPISYAHIEAFRLKSGVVTDSNGFFSLVKLNLIENDTLQVSAVGYKTKIICLNKYLQDFIILEPQIYSLEEVSVSAKTSNTLKYGNYNIKSKFGQYYKKAGEQVGIHILSKDTTKTELIKEVYFYLDTRNNKIGDKFGHGSLNSEFRIRIYSAYTDNDTIKPYKDYMHNSIIVKPNLTKKGWFRVNILKEHIEIPPKGLFICLELIKDNKEGILIGYNKQRKNKSFKYNTYFKYLGWRDWKKWDKYNANALIYATVIVN